MEEQKKMQRRTSHPVLSNAHDRVVAVLPVFWLTDLSEDSGQPWFSTHARGWGAEVSRTTDTLRFWRLNLLIKLLKKVFH